MDVWDEDGEEPGQTAQVEREHHNQGYLAGITQAKESSLQPGFDDGYPYGAGIGVQAGRILGTLQALGLHDLESTAHKELDVARIFSYEYYDKETKPLFRGLHPLIVKWRGIVEGLQTTDQGAVELRRPN